MLETQNNQLSNRSTLSENAEKVPHRHQRPSLWWIVDVCVLIAMSSVLFAGASTQFNLTRTDMSRYQCYATAFWHGLPAIKTFPTLQCAFLINAGANSEVHLVHNLETRGLPTGIGNIILQQHIASPFHVLPPEYPMLTLVPFSIGMLAPPQEFRLTFALGMIAFAWGIYFLLRRSRSRGAAIAFAAYMAIGSYATGAARFDIIASGLTLLAILYAGRSRWRWAFTFLALATMLKLYPLILVPPFVIAQQIQSKQPWLSWQRWKALALFTLICSALIVVSLLLNVQGTLGPLSYFNVRPLQVESFPAALIWLSSFAGNPIHFVNSFGSTNILGNHSASLSRLFTVFLAIGLLLTFYMQLRGKLDLMKSCLLTLLIVIVTSKVFSPQYLMWVTPMIAYIGKSNWRWLLSWGSVGLLTTWIYPFIYLAVPHIADAPRLPAFYPAVLARNILILGIVLALMYQATRIQNPQDDFLLPLFAKFKQLRSHESQIDFTDTESDKTPTNQVLKV